MVPHHTRPKLKKHSGTQSTEVKTKEQTGHTNRLKTLSKRTRMSKQEAWYKERTKKLQRDDIWNQWNFKRTTGQHQEQRTEHPQQSVEQQAEDKQHETKKLCLNMRFIEQKQTTQTANNSKQEHSNSEDETAARHPPSSSSSLVIGDDFSTVL